MKKIKFLIIPLILGIFIASCEKDDPNVIDPILTFPQLLNTNITPVQFNSDTVDAVATAEVTSAEPIKKVTVTILFPNDERQVFELKDDGVAPDQTANDGNYTSRVLFVRTCRLVGDYKAEFIAENQSGLFSGTDTKNFTVSNSGNVPPIANILFITPDSTQLNQSAFFIFTINAIDPNGACDISEVFYTGFAPDNTALTKRKLFDDGSCCSVENTGLTSGDTTANDNIFTRKLFGPPNQTGYYRYYIRAVDRSGDTSNILSDSIYVY